MFYRGESWEKFAGGFALDAEAMDAFNLSYCADAEKRKSAEVSPLEFADVSGFPPTLIVYASALTSCATSASNSPKSSPLPESPRAQCALRGRRTSL